MPVKNDTALAQLIGRRLRRARRLRDMSQEELAAASGVSVETISKIERGKAIRLDLGTYSALARALNVETDWFAPKEGAFDVEFVHRTVELDFQTEDASVVRQTKSARLRALAPQVLGYTDHLSADGAIESLVVDPGTVQNSRNEGGEVFLDVSLPRPLKEDEEVDVSMSFDLLNSFENPSDEYWRVRINHPTELARLVVRFHASRPYLTYKGLEVFTTHQSLYDVQPTDAMKDGRRELVWEIPLPRVGHVYKLCWTW